MQSRERYALSDAKSRDTRCSRTEREYRDTVQGQKESTGQEQTTRTDRAGSARGIDSRCVLSARISYYESLRTPSPRRTFNVRSGSAHAQLQPSHGYLRLCAAPHNTPCGPTNMQSEARQGQRAQNHPWHVHPLQFHSEYLHQPLTVPLTCRRAFLKPCKPLSGHSFAPSVRLISTSRSITRASSTHAVGGLGPRFSRTRDSAQ